jgi:hypothetical protein
MSFVSNSRPVVVLIDHNYANVVTSRGKKSFGDQRHKFETDNETKNIINSLQQAPNIAHQIFYPLLTHCLAV